MTMIAINNVVNSEYTFDSINGKMVYKLGGEVIFEYELPTHGNIELAMAIANAIEKSYKIGSEKTIEHIGKAWDNYTGLF